MSNSLFIFLFSNYNLVQVLTGGLILSFKGGFGIFGIEGAKFHIEIKRKHLAESAGGLFKFAGVNFPIRAEFRNRTQAK